MRLQTRRHVQAPVMATCPFKRQRRSEFSLLVALADSQRDVLAEVLKKLSSHDVRSLCSACSTLRRHCRSLLLQRFVESTLQLNTAHRFGEFRQAERWNYQEHMDSLTRSRMNGRDIQGKEGDFVKCADGMGILAWSHFPLWESTPFTSVNECMSLEWMKSNNGTYWMTGKEPKSESVCYWLSEDWRWARRKFLNVCETGDVSEAVRQCGKVTFGVQKLFRVVLDCCTSIDVFPMEAWWPVEMHTGDYYKECWQRGELNVFVHVESATYMAAALYRTKKFLRRHVLLYSENAAEHAAQVFHKVSIDPSFPEIIAEHLVWVCDEFVQNS